MKDFQPIRGMPDMLPEQAERMQKLLGCAQQVLRGHGYQLIQLPVVESAKLFARSVGEHTDVVQKEMYQLNDRDGENLVLRPEGTVGCVRAAIQHDLIRTSQQRLWYHGPMFRYERPQRGRQRQFWQLGVETMGMEGVMANAEVLLLCDALWRSFGAQNLRLEINHLGGRETRARFRETLQQWLLERKDALDEDTLQRVHNNPLRVLDSKDPKMLELLNDAPTISDYLNDEERSDYAALLDCLEKNQIQAHCNSRLVRGLDYYTGVVFEWTSDELGTQSAVCAGGRYDNLVEQLGGRATPCMGFAMGWERLLLHLDAGEPQNKPAIADAALIPLGLDAELSAASLAHELRCKLPELRLVLDVGAGNLTKKLRRAERLQAKLVLLVGSDELARGVVSVKLLYDSHEQIEVEHGEALCQYLQAHIEQREGKR